MAAAILSGADAPMHGSVTSKTFSGADVPMYGSVTSETISGADAPVLDSMLMAPPPGADMPMPMYDSAVMNDLLRRFWDGAVELRQVRYDENPSDFLTKWVSTAEVACSLAIHTIGKSSPACSGDG